MSDQTSFQMVRQTGIRYVNSDNTACTCIFLSIAGGIVLHAAVLGHEGSLNSLVHEMGHALGLWHVHRGVSEVACGHECYEKHPSMYTGDTLFFNFRHSQIQS